jgi:integrative and conjugative element protein (TIGR02256 family)
MLSLFLPRTITIKLEESLLKAGNLECGGILLGEHVGVNEFAILDITIQGTGTISRFVRKVEEAFTALGKFFKRHENNYARFNYLGEWHSHPLFEPRPSNVDHNSMVEIVTNPEVGANFVVLVIVKLNERRQLIGSAHVYLPDLRVFEATLDIQR